jgi:hypothetical protein
MATMTEIHIIKCSGRRFVCYTDGSRFYANVARLRHTICFIRGDGRHLMSHAVVVFSLRWMWRVYCVKPSRKYRTIQSRDTVTWYSSKIQSRDTSRRYSHMIQSRDTVTWYSHVIQSCDTVAWYSHVVQSRDTVTWYSHVIQLEDTVTSHFSSRTDSTDDLGTRKRDKKWTLFFESEDRSITYGHVTYWPCNTIVLLAMWVKSRGGENAGSEDPLPTLIKGKGPLWYQGP